MPITESLSFFDTVPVKGDDRANGLDPEIAGPILKEVRERLRFLVDVGLDYLTLGRSAESLSGGEAQRIRLATQIGSRLVGVLYILDEPSIGLTSATTPASSPRSSSCAISATPSSSSSTTRRRCAPPTTSSTWGPGAGKHGGEVIAEGTVDEIRALAAVDHRQVPQRRDEDRASPTSAGSFDAKKTIRILNAREHNLRNVDVRDPARALRRITGVSGSGKSTLIEDILHQSLARHFYRRAGHPGSARSHHGPRAHRQGHRHRPEPDRSHAALQPGDVHGALHADPRALRRAAPRRRSAATGPVASPST
jgi:excinuclease ABC subunit A